MRSCGVIHDPGDLLRIEPRVDGVIDRAGAGDPVPGFEVTGGVPGERRDPVAGCDAVALETLRDLQRARCGCSRSRFAPSGPRPSGSPPRDGRAGMRRESMIRKSASGQSCINPSMGFLLVERCMRAASGAGRIRKIARFGCGVDKMRRPRSCGVVPRRGQVLPGSSCLGVRPRFASPPKRGLTPRFLYGFSAR